MTARRCPTKGCPKLIHGTARYCTDHARDYETRRGTSTQRGYGQTHHALRKAWQTRINTAPPHKPIPCTRCGNPIPPGTPWDLGHHDTDRTQHTGPEHQHCNRSAGGQAAHLWPD